MTQSALARVWRGLQALQNRIAVALTVGLLFILYFTLFAVVAIVARLTGKDLLHLDKPLPGSYWLQRAPADNRIESFAQQF